jgi:hypothetical protein
MKIGVAGLDLRFDDAAHAHGAGKDHRADDSQHQRQLVRDQLAGSAEAAHQRVLVSRRPSGHKHPDGADRRDGKGIEHPNREVTEDEPWTERDNDEQCHGADQHPDWSGFEHGAVGVGRNQVFLLEELDAVGDELRPTPAAARKVGTDPVLHFCGELHLGEPNDHADEGNHQCDQKYLAEQRNPEI